MICPVELQMQQVKKCEKPIWNKVFLIDLKNPIKENKESLDQNASFALPNIFSVDIHYKLLYI